MKKRFGLYAAFWSILLVIFNAIAFLSVGWIWFEKYTPSFWIGYGFITATFIGQLICAYVTFKPGNSNKLLYNISLIKKSYSGLIASFVFGGLCMLISPLPYWVGAILCSIVLVLNILSLLKATVAISEVAHIDQKIKAQPFFIKSLTLDADTLLASAKSEAVKAECTKVYEAIRYSDPMSNEILTSVETQITLKFEELSDAVKADDADAVANTAKELLVLVKDRNNKSKLLK